MGTEKIEIRPGVAILSMLKHLNYKPYYALAEFIDNSIDSFLKNKASLRNIHGINFQLKVSIELNKEEDKITIRDNAAGIDSSNYQRAFRPAEIPPDNTKLSEFGMGMKSASCWFANKWSVRSTALGESTERIVNFNIEEIVNDTKEELDIHEKEVNKDSHYTVVSLFGVEKKMPVKRTLSVVKRHLTSIYRDFIRKGILVLELNGEELSYSAPEILKSKQYDQINNPDAETIEWKKNVTIDFGDDFRATGFVALMEKSSRRDSGFALFRRGRVIEGSADNDEGFRPKEIFKQLGSPTYIRLFGELHLEGFNVSHTKDGFQWDDNMEVFLETLKEELSNDNELPILKQADKYRVKESKQDLSKVAQGVVDSTIKTIDTEELSSNITQVAQSKEQKIETLKDAKESYTREFSLEFNGINWKVFIELSYDESIDELIEVGEHLATIGSNDINTVKIRLSLIHPFMINFIGSNKDRLEPFLRFVIAICLSEISLGKLYPNTDLAEIRLGVNTLLKGTLSEIS